MHTSIYFWANTLNYLLDRIIKQTNGLQIYTQYALETSRLAQPAIFHSELV